MHVILPLNRAMLRLADFIFSTLPMSSLMHVFVRVGAGPCRSAGGGGRHGAVRAPRVHRHLWARQVCVFMCPRLNTCVQHDLPTVQVHIPAYVRPVRACTSVYMRKHAVPCASGHGLINPVTTV